MARANRHFIPGQVWHITHRCHKRDFLLKFVKDRRGWTEWLQEATYRYDLMIFNWIVTSNHIHLLVLDEAGQVVIPKSIKLVAGRTAQEYNKRKRRKGAFWEDRYRATAIEAESHLLRCLVYIDLNMVRAGVVRHPSEWPFNGYHEIQSPRQEGIIEYKKIAEKAGFESYEPFKLAHKKWVNEALTNGRNTRQSEWSDSIAVGSREFTLRIKEKLGIRAKGRTAINGNNGVHQLRESITCYSESDNFVHNEGDSRCTIGYYFWETFSE